MHFPIKIHRNCTFSHLEKVARRYRKNLMDQTYTNGPTNILTECAAALRAWANTKTECNSSVRYLYYIQFMHDVLIFRSFLMTQFTVHYRLLLRIYTIFYVFISYFKFLCTHDALYCLMCVVDLPLDILIYLLFVLFIQSICMWLNSAEQKVLWYNINLKKVGLLFNLICIVA